MNYKLPVFFDVALISVCAITGCDSMQSGILTVKNGYEETLAVTITSSGQTKVYENCLIEAKSSRDFRIVEAGAYTITTDKNEAVRVAVTGDTAAGFPVSQDYTQTINLP